jgi:branched-chain amino acid transport system permease protein
MGSIGSNVIVHGLLTGLVYGLMALGFSVIFQGMRVANFAHGAPAILAMYSAFLLFRTIGLDPLLTFIPIAGVFFGLGCPLQRLLLAPFLRRPQHQQFMLLIGPALVIANALVLTLGPEAHAIELSYRPGTISSVPSRSIEARADDAASFDRPKLLLLDEILAGLRPTEVDRRACASSIA